MTTRFIVVRHGETQWNVAGRIQGHGDSDLTETGRAQADAIASRLAAESFDAIVASDLGRAFDTAQAIARGCGLPIATDRRLRERSFGVGEGLTYEEIDRQYPDIFSRVRSTDPDAPIPGGESRRQFHERVRAAFEALAEAYLPHIRWEPHAALGARTAALLPGLMLARIDGKSPVEYLTEDAVRDDVRSFARALLAVPVADPSTIAQRWVARPAP